MKFNEFNNWNEFHWEKELRKQENCIAAYIKELDNFIDIPNESEIIFKKLEESKLINTKNVNPYELFAEEKDINDALFMEYSDNKSHIKLFTKLSGLAADFNLVLSKELSKDLIINGLKVLSLYGKVLNNLIDFIDLDDDTLPTLKIALTKRIVHSINKIIGYLKILSVKLISNKNKIERQIKDLLFIREIIVDIRYKCKTAK